MQKLLIFSFILTFSKTFSQGIVFETNWKTAREKAQQEKKLLFVDFYTDWCAPCKMIEKEIFSDSSVGDFFRKNFIAVKINGEKEEGKRLGKAYSLYGYPTLIYVNSDNLDVVARSWGVNNKAEFLDLSQKAFNSKGIEPLSILQKKYESGQKSKQFLENLMYRKSLCGINVKDEIKTYLQSFPLDGLFTSITQLNDYRVFNVYYPSAEYSFFKNIKRKNDIANYFIQNVLYGSTSATFDSVNMRRDIAKLGPLLNEIKEIQSPQKAEYFKVKYAQGDSNTVALFNATNRYVNAYLTTDSVKDVRKQDSLRFLELLSGYHNSVDSMLKYRNDASYLNDMKNQKALIISGSISDLVEPLLLRLKDKKLLQTTLIWTKYAHDLMPNSPTPTYMYAMNLYQLGEKGKATKLMSEIADYFKIQDNRLGFKDNMLEKFAIGLDKMQKGSF